MIYDIFFRIVKKKSKDWKTSQLEFQPNFQVPLVVSLPSLPSSEVGDPGELSALRKTWKKMEKHGTNQLSMEVFNGFHGKIIYKSISVYITGNQCGKNIGKNIGMPTKA